jgi:hypothetical protein
VIGHQPLELLAGVLAATVGVMQQRIRFCFEIFAGDRRSGLCFRESCSEEGVSQMALIVSGIERSGNSDGSFSIVLRSVDGELNAVIPQNLVLPLQSALQRHLLHLAFDQSSSGLATTGVPLPALTIQETKTATKGR